MYPFGMSSPVCVSAAEAELGIAQLRDKLGTQVDLVFYRDQVLYVRRHQRRMAVLISPDRYDALITAAGHRHSPERVGDD